MTTRGTPTPTPTRAQVDRATPIQARVLGQVKLLTAAKGYPPTVRELCVATGIRSYNGVHSHLVALERKGYLKRTPGASRGLLVLPRGMEPTPTDAPSPDAPATDAPSACTEDGKYCAHSDAAAEASAALELLAQLVAAGDPQAKVMAADLLAPDGLPKRLRVRFIDGGFALHGAAWIVRLYAATFARLVSEAGAANYTETPLEMPADEYELKPAGTARPWRILVTAVRPEGRSPHELRTAAEARVAELEDEVRQLRAQVVMAPSGAGPARAR